MESFKELMANLKELLKAKLNDENLELFTEVDKGLDKLSESHEKTESDLSSTKDKLIEVVKSTSFKDDREPNLPNDNTDDPMDIDKALETSIEETIKARK